MAEFEGCYSTECLQRLWDLAFHSIIPASIIVLIGLAFLLTGLAGLLLLEKWKTKEGEK